MPKVTLSKAVAWPHPHGLMRHSGVVLDVTDAEFEQLDALGAVAPVIEVADKAPATKTVKADAAPVEVADKAPARPKNTAKIDVWRKYAEALGVDHKGLDKAEIIAATS